MDNQLKPNLIVKTLSHKEPDSFGIDDKKNRIPYYKKCRYIGTAGLGGINYYQYICPNMYNASADAFLELNIPFLKSSPNSAVVKAVDRSVLQDKLLLRSRIAYIEFNDGYHAINPKEIQYVDQSLPPNPFSVDYPTLITFAPGRLRYGQKMDINAFSKEDLKKIGKSWNYYLVCPEAGRYYDGMKEIVFDEQALRTDCELWYWPNQMMANGDIETGVNKTHVELKRYAGYLWTVPVDIITAPLQLIGLLLLKAAWTKSP